MFFDTHAHLDDPAFDTDRESLCRQMKEFDIDLIIDPGCDPVSSRKAAQIAENWDYIYFAAGIHPEEWSKYSEKGFEEICRLTNHHKCVAVGEIGLDYYWDNTHKEEQKTLFHRQLSFACDHDLPVIVHDREAHGDCLNIVRQYPSCRGVFHCFSGSAEMAEELIRLGWYLGFDGPITYKNAKKSIEVLKICPLNRILIETDSPYLPPVPMRGKRNDPRNLPFICKKIAEVKEKTEEEIAEITLLNGSTLFGVPLRTT